jgi:multiple sugar transport system permease protein
VDWLGLLDDKPVWLLGTNTLWAIVIPTIWRQWPFSMLMLLAGLQGIPKDIYEAASLDGAGPWKRFTQITWPLLKPVWAILILHGMIFNVYSFNIVIMMFGNGAGFPGKYGDLLMTNIFRNSFQMWDFGSGAATSSLLMLAMVALVFIWFRIFRNSLQAP